MCDQREMVQGEEMALAWRSHLDKCIPEFWDAKSPFQHELHPSGHDTSPEAYPIGIYVLGGKAISSPDMGSYNVQLFWSSEGCCHYTWVSRNPRVHQGCPAELRWFGAPGVLFPHHGRTATVQWCRGAAMGWFTMSKSAIFGIHVELLNVQLPQTSLKSCVPTVLLHHHQW